MSALPTYLTSDDVADAVRRALGEDVRDGDITTLATVRAGTSASAELIAKEDGILAGRMVFDEVFRQIDPAIRIEWHADDGGSLHKGSRVASLQGSAHGLLSGERTALNLLQRMSGIATATRAMVEAVRPHPTRILDTRKTAPGLRLLDKWAVLLGGGQNHRIGLFDMILIKENHIAAAGGITAALQGARAWIDRNRVVPIEIETRNLGEVTEVLEAGGADFILLDNMVRRTNEAVDVSLLAEAIELIAGRCKTEASGNVSLDAVNTIASTGVDFISSGALTHSARALDLSLLVEI